VTFIPADFPQLGFLLVKVPLEARHPSHAEEPAVRRCRSERIEVADLQAVEIVSVDARATPVAGSATTADFGAAPITLSWADGDSAPKTATIPIVNDNIVESPESFTVELSNPTNGAVIGPHSRVVVTIHDPPPPPPPSGGGGAFDWFALLCLGCVRWLRRRAFPETTADNTN
jgi:hypothetical protein